MLVGMYYWREPLYLPADNFVKKEPFLRQKNHRMVVFIHGTFGAVLSLLDAPGVLHDSVKGSFYEKVVTRARSDQFFFKNQPLAQCGLISFEPSFECHESVGFFAAYPIAKTFDLMCDQVQKDAEQRHYYLFGWSGLLSQESRRQEALRLLNLLSEEVQKFKDQKIDPKITLICHSHGGNVALNLGLFVSFLRGENLSSVRGVVHARSYKKLRSLLDVLPDRQSVIHKQDMQKWDYKPNVPSWNIDQVVLLATPIQPETDAAIFSSFFNRVYNCYSYADAVQVSDWISTKRYFSERRFARIKRLLRRENQQLPGRLRQVRIMVGRQKDKAGKLIFRVSSQADPAHKDFWFLLFRRMKRNHLFKPLPVLTLFPLISDVLFKNDQLLDVDVNIVARSGELVAEVVRHNSCSICGESKISQKVFEVIRSQAGDWNGNERFFSRILRMLHFL